MDDRQIIALYWARAEDAVTETAKRYGRYCQIAGDLAKEGVQPLGTVRRYRVPCAQPGVIDALLAVLAAMQDVIRDGVALNRWEKAAAAKRGCDQVEAALEELHDCLPTADSVEAALDTIALTDALNRFLASLPAETRRMFVQRYWYMRPIKSIAAELCAGESKVKMTLLRARAELKQHLKKEGIYL